MLHNLQIFNMAAANIEAALHLAADVTDTFNEQVDTHSENVLVATDLEALLCVSTYVRNT